MTAVGVIVATQSSRPSHQLAAVVPHLAPLADLADRSSLRPRDHSILNAFLDSHRFSTASSSSCFPSLWVRSPSQLARRPTSIYDPLLELPSIVNALGLILPEVLRALLVFGTRLLIFSPQGVETRSAASIAWVLAEIVEAALGTEGDDEGPEEASVNTSLQKRQQHIPQVRGIIGLHNISDLQDEEKRRRQLTTMTGVKPMRGWISWTTDKLYLDKADLYDCLLDLTPLIQDIPCPPSGAGMGATVLSAYDESAKGGGDAPHFYRVQRPEAPLSIHQSWNSSNKRLVPAKLNRQTWRTRDFSVYRDNELQSASYESKPRRLARRSSRNSLPSRAHPFESDRQDSPPSGNRRIAAPGSRASKSLARLQSQSVPISRQIVRFLSILVDFVHYYLSTQAILPRPWRLHLHDQVKLGGESYGYVPLGIRSDGGVQAGLMLLPDESESDSDSEGDEVEDEEDETDPHADIFRGARVPLQRAEPHSTTSSLGKKVSSRLLQVNRASSMSPTSHRRHEGEPFSDSEDSDDESEGTSGSERVSMRKRSISSVRSGGGDLDPMLAACGASPNSASSIRRAKKGSISSSSANRHSFNTRKRSSSRTSSRQREERGWTDEEISATLTNSSQAGVPDPGLGPGKVKDAMLGADRRISGEEEASGEGNGDLEASVGTLMPAFQHSADKSHSAASGMAEAEPTEEEGGFSRVAQSLDPHETFLARAIFTAWAEWLSQLVDALEDLRSSSSSSSPSHPPFRSSSSLSGEHNITPPGRKRAFSASSLFEGAPHPQPDSTLAAVEEEDLPPLSSREIYNVAGLNTRYEPDRLLVLQWTGREIKLEPAWKFWKGWSG